MSTDEHLDALLARFPDTMTTEEVAEVLRLGGAAVRRMLNDRELPGFQVGRHWVIPKSELRAFLLARHNRKPAEQENTND